MSWKDHDFEVELGVELPEVPISRGEDWIDDCEEDDIFDLNPECFKSKAMYEAALQLCKVCAGWFYFQSEEEKNERIKLLRRIVISDKDSPLQYFDINYGTFDWCQALRDRNEKYRNSLYGVDNTWSLFSLLGERSLLEKASCFEWLIDYFGEILEYESHYTLVGQFVSGYGNDLEIMLTMKPQLVEKILNGYSKLAGDDLVNLAKAAAGLIRYGQKNLGLNLYGSVFERAKQQKESSDIRKSIVDGFIERLSKGYDDEPYLSEDIAEVIKKQIDQFSDKSWKYKVETVLRRNVK